MTFGFQRVGRREVVARFDGGRISSDGGALLLGEVERHTGILSQFAGCFDDYRDEELVEHSVEQLVSQRVYGLALGYEDLNDHDTLRHDPLLATLVGHDDPLGRKRRRKADRGVRLAGKSTLNRLELTPVGAKASSRYKKIRFNVKAYERVLTNLFIQAHATPPKRIVLDIDATHDPIHGNQLGKFFHGYYDCHCYLPLYVTCGSHVLCAKLRPSNIDGATGSVGVLSRIIEQIRCSWPDVEIVVRADSGFCRENLLRWCEENGVYYVIGLAKNARLLRMIGKQMHQAKLACEQTGQAARVFTDLDYRTKKSRSRSRRTVAKAEHLPGTRGENPRLVVTNIPAEELSAQVLYEECYCARGDMENRIKEQQLGLFADRTSCHAFVANQFRLLLASAAYVLVEHLRRVGLAGTELADAQVSTIRHKLFKIAARVKVSVRRVVLHLASGYPYQSLLTRLAAGLVNRDAPAPAPT